MNTLIIKKIKIADILKIIMIVSISFTLLMFIIGATTNITSLIAIGFLGFVVAVPTTIIYIEKFKPIKKSVKYLNKYGLQEVINDVKPNEFNLPTSKIYMGERAFFAKNPSSIIPYSMIAWVYIQQTKYMGVIPVDEKVNVFCRDGELFEIRANRNELSTLLQKIQLCSPELIIGYGNEQTRQYYNIRKKFKNNK